MIDILEMKMGQKLDAEVDRLLTDIQVQMVGKHGFQCEDAKELIRDTIISLKDKDIPESVIFCVIDSVWNACMMEIQ